MAGAFVFIFGLTVLYAVAFKVPVNLSRLWWLMWLGGTMAGGTASRIVVRRIAAYVRARGIDVRRAVIVGSGPDAMRIVEALQQQRGAGIRMQGWFDVAGQGATLPNMPRLGDLDQLSDYVGTHHIHQVWITLPMSEQREIVRILNSLAHSTADIKFVPDLLGLQLLNHSVEQVAGFPVINLQETPLHGNARIIKGIEDRILAFLILLGISPLMLLIAIAVKLSSPGPVFYRQERMSWNNKTFGMLKFRSMPVDAEKQTGAVWARAGENRATRVGSFLRKTSLDELPQFLNVLKGEMSIVGPRPERPVFVEKFKNEIPAYMKKHMVKAGITGWAQVNGLRGSTDLRSRIEHDLHYIENWSVMLDLKIICLTLFKGFLHKNAY
jgi:putative colanic acid biosynthesis UDP-glucose lipid carrier transferase